MVIKGMKLCLDDLLELQVGDKVYIEPTERAISRGRDINYMLLGCQTITKIDKDSYTVIIGDYWNYSKDEYIINAYEANFHYDLSEALEILKDYKSTRFADVEDRLFEIYRGKNGKLMYEYVNEKGELPIFYYLDKQWEVVE